jgi:hypothetical protein
MGWRWCEEEKEEAGMYVRTLAFCLLFFYNDFSFTASVVSSGIERLDWRLGGSNRGYGERCQTVQTLARDFRLGLAGGRERERIWVCEGGWDGAIE